MPSAQVVVRLYWPDLPPATLQVWSSWAPTCPFEDPPGHTTDVAWPRCRDRVTRSLRHSAASDGQFDTPESTRSWTRAARIRDGLMSIRPETGNTRIPRFQSSPAAPGSGTVRTRPATTPGRAAAETDDGLIALLFSLSSYGQSRWPQLPFRKIKRTGEARA
jgi:hypothetical protein